MHASVFIPFNGASKLGLAYGLLGPAIRGPTGESCACLEAFFAFWRFAKTFLSSFPAPSLLFLETAPLLTSGETVCVAFQRPS
jgi:hypothetical protein